MLKLVSILTDRKLFDLLGVGIHPIHILTAHQHHLQLVQRSFSSGLRHMKSERGHS